MLRQDRVGLHGSTGDGFVPRNNISQKEIPIEIEEAIPKSTMGIAFEGLREAIGGTSLEAEGEEIQNQFLGSLESRALERESKKIKKANERELYESMFFMDADRILHDVMEEAVENAVMERIDMRELNDTERRANDFISTLSRGDINIEHPQSETYSHSFDM
jgi:hypothetical protein